MLNKPLTGRNTRRRANWPATAIAFCLLAFLTIANVAAQSGTPRGWLLAGDHPQNYITGVDEDVVYNGHPSAYLKAKPSATEGFGTLIQEFDATQYIGKRVRLSAWVKTENVAEWAGLWMRVNSGPKSIAFDNMQNRLIRGTTDWQNFAVVLDVPQDATGIFFGILLQKTGNVWLNSVKFETVGTDVPVTDMWSGRAAQPQTAPTNLNFED